MNFLAPAFLAGLGALAVPVIIHLIHRERRTVVPFPSLMFLQRIPYRSVRRQKIRHLLLLLLRCAALALLVAAFARPFFAKRTPAVIGTSGPREVVILVDNSASMGYGSRWFNATTATQHVIDALRPGDRGTLVLFANEPAVISEPNSQRDRLMAALNHATLSSEATRYAPALKLASQILGASTLPQKEVVLITDFQKNGWTGRDEIILPPGTRITPVDLTGKSNADVAVSSVSTDRDTNNARARVTIAARITNTGPARTLAATLEVGGRTAESKQVTVSARGATQVRFASIAVPTSATKARVFVSHDSLQADDELNFSVAPDEAVSVLLVEPGNSRPNQGLFVSRALAIGTNPSFRVEQRTIDALRPADLDRRALVILDEVTPPNGESGTRLRNFISNGGGLVVVPGSQRTEAWSAEWRAMIATGVGDVVDRSSTAGATLSSLDYGHPIFEMFSAPGTGDFSTARFLRYRRLTPRGDSGIVARFDDGLPAIVERRAGVGKVLVWASSLDAFWTDLPLQPVWLPFVHQLARDVGRYADPRPFYAAGDVLDLSRHGELTSQWVTTGDTTADLVLESPSHVRTRVSAEGAGHLVSLRERGFYELRGRTTPAGSGRPIAVNVATSELDLSHFDPQELTAALSASMRADPAHPLESQLTPEDQERRQRVWWYLLLGAVLLMAAETVMSNRLSRASS